MATHIEVCRLKIMYFKIRLLQGKQKYLSVNFFPYMELKFSAWTY
jgi:hypothetical protein